MLTRPLHLPLLLALFALLALPNSLFAAEPSAPQSQESEEEEKDDDEVPPWMGDDEEGEDSGDSQTEGEEKDENSSDPEASPASGPAASSEPSATNSSRGPGPRGGGPFGIGFSVGTLNGLSVKIWPVETHGVVIQLGGSHLLNSMTVSLSYRIHPPKIAIPGSPVAMHFNLGPMFRTRMVFYGNGTYTELGGGAAIGMSITVAQVPAEVFMEVAPTFVGGVGPANVGIGFDVGGRVGARFYLGKK